MGGCAKPKCCAPSNCCTALKNLFCTFIELFKARFITGVVSFRYIGLGETGVNVTSRASRIEDYEIFNNAASLVYVKIYDKGDSVPVVGDNLLIKRTLLIPAQSGANLADLNIPFENGIGLRATTGPLDSDVGAPPADSVIVNIGYKNL